MQIGMSEASGTQLHVHEVALCGFAEHVGVELRMSTMRHRAGFF